MAHILITSGPTRQYLDPVRYLTNASSGRMGVALAEAALAAGHQVTIVSGPVAVNYPAAARVVDVVSTEDMLAASAEIFPACQGLIGVAAPCDYRPELVASQKIQKTGEPLVLYLHETPDVVATLGSQKAPSQWVVGFALETEDARFRAIVKAEKKHCDMIVLNGPEAMHAAQTRVEVLTHHGESAGTFEGSKESAAREIFRVINQRLVQPREVQP
ncbi:MAG: phosphopantothenoylcysteine decarboxylase [Pirellulales bacterium]|nr:phosphopantothenoylcysteine decarboxylase [Pirellulales bacterium]